MKKVLMGLILLGLVLSGNYLEITNIKSLALYKGTKSEIDLSVKYYPDKSYFSLDYFVVVDGTKITYTTVLSSAELIIFNKVISNFITFTSKKPKVQEDINISIAKSQAVSAIGFLKIYEDGTGGPVNALIETQIFYNLVYIVSETSYVLELFLEDQKYYCSTTERYWTDPIRCPSIILLPEAAKTLYDLTSRDKLLKLINSRKTDVEKMIDQMKLTK